VTSSYSDFIESKHRRFQSNGIALDELSPALYGFQSHIVRWALGIGRSCIFADCGLGKTIMQLEWAHRVCDHTAGRVLVLSPLAVAAQTEREAARFGYKDVARSEAGSDDGTRIVLTNYERLHHFDPDDFVGVVLDESSILKSYTGHFRNEIINGFAGHRFKLACTATPAPNDVMELGNHAEFVGAMTRTEMLSMFFVHDGGETQKWRLKGHARDEFWKWVMSWASVVSRPSDLGFSDDGFDLPELHYHTHTVEAGVAQEGMLFDVGSPTLTERRHARRSSLDSRCQVAADLASDTDEQWILWCDLNDESARLAELIPEAVEVRGSDTNEHKRNAMLGFSDGDIRVLVTKPKIAGFGMNWQNCARMAFVGLSDSYEALYQSTRRCWRFGQPREVEAHIITSTAEGAVLKNVTRKESDHREMQRRMRALTLEFGGTHKHVSGGIGMGGEASGDGWTLVNGDCVDVLRTTPDESIGYSIFSPPFASLYTYSDSPADMGNCQSDDEFFDHFGYLAPELYRVTEPGRLLSFHCMLLPSIKVRDGVIGLKDFRGDLIRIFSDAGWIYHSEVCIWKDPVTAMQRTKALGLLHKTIRKDSAMSRQGIPDYVVTMRKPGENANPIAHDASEFPVSLWQRWASPIWTDINPNDTLQYRSAREDTDERHICPLQLEVIRRCIGLWTNRGDLVLSPFAGIGSEGYEALRWGRRFLGIELKRSYWDLAQKNLRSAVEEQAQADLFS
jgi:hypothetical protein